MKFPLLTFQATILALGFIFQLPGHTHTQVELKALAPSTGAFVPGFSPARPGYQMRVKNSVESISFTAESSTPTATIFVNGAPYSAESKYPLQVGVNDLEISLKPSDPPKTYHVRIEREYPLPNWTKVLANGPFHIRDSAGELVFNNRMWLFGGYFPEVSSDVWSSSDGTNWKESTSIPAKSGINIPLNYVHKKKMWIVSNSGELYSTPDGEAWTLVNEKPAFGKRYAPGGAVFKNKMWILGGQQGTTRLNDIWSSADGLTWKQEVASAPWSPRQLFGNVVVKNNKMWLIGGGVTSYAPFKGYRDVWVSEDGVNWKEVTDNAPWPARIWSNCVVYNNRIFLLGGFHSQPVWENLGDVWYSDNGKDWHELKTDDIWEARHEHSSYVFNDKLWVVGGNKWPLLNDVWSLEIKGLTFVTQPVVQEYVGMQYSYRAGADFNKSSRPVNYRLKNAPAWLKVNALTGILKGTPPTAGKFDVELEAYDGVGETTHQRFTINVTTLQY